MQLQLVFDEQRPGVHFQGGADHRFAGVVDRCLADGVGVGQLLALPLAAHRELVVHAQGEGRAQAAFDDRIGCLGATGGADVVLVLGPVRAELGGTEIPLAVVVQRQRTALELTGTPCALVLLFQRLGDEGLLHAVARLQRHFLCLAQFPLQQRVDIAVLLAGVGIAIYAAVGAVRVAAHAVGTDAQAEALAQRAGEGRADLLGVATVAILRPGVAVGGAAVPAVTDALGDDVDHPAHRVRAI
ncbi:hypothetical protein D3C73_1020450 [compost metagenome]